MTQIRELTEGDAPAVTALYTTYGWWADREEDSVKRAIAHTDLALGIEIDGSLIASVRVQTDFEYYANIVDLIVAPEWRNNGFGRQLITETVNHPRLESVETITVHCIETLTHFYESIGFERCDDTVTTPDGKTVPLVRMRYS